MKRDASKRGRRRPIQTIAACGLEAQYYRKQQPDNPTLARNLALTYARLGDPRAAALTSAAQRLGERQERRRALRRRHRREPANATVTLQLARLELAAGQTREANDLARQVLAADPTNRPALELLHQILGAP